MTTTTDLNAESGRTRGDSTARASAKKSAFRKAFVAVPLMSAALFVSNGTTNATLNQAGVTLQGSATCGVISAAATWVWVDAGSQSGWATAGAGHYSKSLQVPAGGMTVTVRYGVSQFNRNCHKPTVARFRIYQYASFTVTSQPIFDTRY